MKYPKVRGTGSDLARVMGEAKIRALQAVDVPFLSASGPGYEARTRGETSEVVTSGEEGEESSLRMLTSTSGISDNVLTHPVLRADALDGVFRETRAAEGVTVLGFGSGPVWAGRAMATTGNDVVFVDDGAGGTLTASSVTHSSTKNGKTFTTTAAFVSCPPQIEGDGSGSNILAEDLPLAARVSDGGVVRWAFGFGFTAAPSLTPGARHQAAYLYSTDSGQSGQAATIGLGPGYWHAVPHIQRVRPTRLLMVVPTMRSSAGLPISPSLVYPFVGVIEGNGTGFTSISAGALVNDLAVPPDSRHLDFDRMQVRWRNGMRSCALADGSALVLVGGNCYGQEQYDTTPTAEPLWRAGTGTLRAYKLDLAGGSTLVETFAPGASRFLQGYVGFAGLWLDAHPEETEAPSHLRVIERLPPPFVVQGVPIFVGWTRDPFVTPNLYIGSADGTTWESRPMPRPQWQTGHPFALDTRTIACPMYDGEAVKLYVSTDLGQSWTAHTRYPKTSQTPAQQHERAVFLTSYAHTLLTRINGRSANPLPGQPWVCDDSVPMPPGVE